MSLSQMGQPQAARNLAVRSRVRDYRVEFDDGDAWIRELAALEHTFVVVDENVLALHGDGVLAALRREDVAVLPISEEHKVFDTVAGLCALVTERAAKRNLTIVSIGGGITQDVTGFLASVLYRGVGWIYAPSTLLAMGDSCIGGKTSLNLGAHKNLLGTIYPPNRVIVHTPFVATLPAADFASGIGEIVKLHLLGGSDHAAMIRAALPALMRRDTASVSTAIHASLEIKRDYIEDDEFDRGRRNLLNLGHCFGHAIEAATDFAIPHGLGVVIGMRLADLVAIRRGLLAPVEAEDRQRELYDPVMPAWPVFDGRVRTSIVEAMAYDKKRTGAGLAVVVLADALRPVQLSDVTPQEATSAVEGLGVDTA